MTAPSETLDAITPTPHRAPRWRTQLRAAIRDPDALITRLALPDALRAAAREAAETFELVVPEPFLARMRSGDPTDPLLLQVLPLAAELAESPAGFSADPVGESEASIAAGLLQKYPGRALLLVAGVCAVGCRYCFRRHYPYADGPGSLAGFEDALREIAASAELEEIILSGGDPLMRSDEWLGQLAHQLDAIPHLRRLRIHTRLPIVLPDRIDEHLLGWLTTTRLSPLVVVHTNHPAELDQSCGDALLRLVRAGVPVLNQTVLLRGINDDPDVLAELSKRLLDVRVMPYYLHQLDPVTGAAHFEVPVERGLELIAELRRRLPGFGVPRYVREVVGEPHKVDVTR